MTFDDLGLSAPILKSVAAQGYSEPSPIQAKAIPAVLAGHDVMAAAQTGTGKTAGFTLPILERLAKGRRAGANQARTLILTPTRELAAQVGESVAVYSKHLNLSHTVVFGGVKINPQMIKLRRGVDVLVATPGRLMDLHSQNAVKFDHLEVLVLDEADRMLDMGFIHDIKRIIGLLPKRRQNLMFSATFSDDIRALAKGLVRNPIEISVSPRNAAAPSVEQWICPVDKKQKGPLLIKLIKDGGWDQALVFSKTKHGANKLTKQLIAAGITAAAIHGNKSQGARTKALADFKANEIRILVATDIAARGLDIEQLPQVVNFDLPNISEDYVHRIGRTGRAGSTGQAISLVSADEVDLLSDIERLTQKLLERREIEGFEPDQNLPETTLNKSVRRKKPRKALSREGNNKDNSRHNNKSSQSKKRSAYGHGPKAGNKLKFGGRNQTRKPGERADSRGELRDSDDSRSSDSRGNAAPRKPSGNSPYGSGGGRNASGRKSPSGGNSNRSSGRR
jgi:ATP-dependent RNA helicase RhlE